MKMNNLLIVAALAAMIGGVTLINRTMNPGTVDAARMERADEVAERIQMAQAEAGTDASVWPTTAPDEFKVKFECSMGDFVLEIHKKWAPLGVERFYQILREGIYDDARFFRVVPDFVVQWGIPGDPALAAQWRDATIKDDPVIETNAPGTISFATSGVNSRTTQVFINFGDNANLDAMGFAPFGKVVEGMENVRAITPQYGQQPNQTMIQAKGNEYLKESFPNLDYIKRVTLVQDAAPAAEAPAEAPAEEAAPAEAPAPEAAPAEAPAE
ncbi:MAG: hypothetical protein GC168_19310 [Candidatus Hydrogenedens sp.]|nr:hypothetical protein [Candidatus Hydrogenedens sp.]